MIDPRVKYENDAKPCIGCGETLDVTNFKLDNRGYYASRCRPCTNIKQRESYHEDPETRRRYHKKWREDNPEKYRECAERWRKANEGKRRAERYGMTVEQMHQLFEDANHSCQICGVKKDRMHIDHCHETGAVRGLLCSGCNTSIGRLGDRSDLVMRAVEYLRGAEGDRADTEAEARGASQVQV